MNAETLLPVDTLLGRREDIGGRELIAVRRADLDDAARQKRTECSSCKHEPSCEGVWGNYLRRFGWDEFVPVT